MRWLMKMLALLITAAVIAMGTFVFALTEQAAARSPRGPIASASPRALAVEEEGEAEEGESEEAEEDEEESEEGGSGSGLPQGVPDECIEYTVAACVVSSLSRQTVLLELRYDSSESGEASLSYMLKGSFTVRVILPGTPSYCEIYSTRHLTSQHRTGEQTTWSERPSGSQPLRRPSLQR